MLGDGGLSTFLKMLVDSGTMILKFANSDIGQAIIKLVALKATFDLLNKGFNSFLAFGTKLEMLQGGFTEAQIASALLNKEFVGLDVAIQAVGANILKTTKAWIVSPFGQVALVVGGIIAIKEIVDKLTVSFEEQKESLNNANKEYENASNQAETTKQKLEEVKDKIDKINSLDGINITDNEELSKLQAEKEELEYILAIEEERKRVAKEKAEQEALATLNKQVEDKDAFGSVTVGGGAKGFENEIIGSGTSVEALSNLTEKMKVLNTELADAKNKREELARAGESETSEYKKISAEVEKLENDYNNLSKKSLDYADVLKDSGKNLDKNSKKYKKVEGALQDYADVTGEHIDLLDDESKATKEQEKNADALGSTYDTVSSDSLSKMNDATKDQQDLIKDLASNIDEITNAYQTAVNAIAEYNNQGYLSVDTYSQLMQVAPQYLATLIDENGQFYANADGVTTLYQAQIYEMGVTAARAQVNLASKLSDEAGAYANLGNQAINASGGIWELLKVEMAEKIARVKENPEDYKALQNRINAINELTQSTIKNAKVTTNSVKPVKQNTGAHKKNTGARKKNADATKAQTSALKAQKKALEDEAKALEKQIDDYEIVIDYVKDLLKEEQEAIEEQKDKELDAIKEKMEALEEEQDAFNDNLDKQIEALEDKRDEQEEYWDAQIDSIRNANEELEENIRLQELQEAVARARAKKRKVFKDGKFVYAQDDEEITKAEQELMDYQQQLAVQKQIKELEKLKEEALNSLDNQIQELEDYKDKTNQNYEQQLKDLQNYYNKVELEYDKRIKQYDVWLKQFEDMLNASAKRHAQILYNELVGEQGNWDARIKALSRFVDDYDAKKRQLDGIKNQINAITNQISGLESRARTMQANINGIAGDAQRKINALNSLNNQANSMKPKSSFVGRVKDKNGIVVQRTNRTDSRDGALSQARLWERTNAHWLKGMGFSPTSTDVETVFYNKGTLSTPKDEIAVIGDPARPSNRELVIPPKLNKGDGVLTNLKAGTGVIPHGKNLTENLINLARWSQNGGLQSAVNNNSSSPSYNFTIENINLPQIQNGEQFVEYLQNNFVNDAIQYSNIRG